MSAFLLPRHPSNEPSGRLAAIALTAAVAALFCSPVTTAGAEPVLDRALSGVQLAQTPDCAFVKIEFNFRVQYTSHFPMTQGDNLQISVRAIDSAQAQALALLKREAVRSPDPERTSIASIDLETSGARGPVLHIRFTRAATYAVAQGGDFASIVVAIRKLGGKKACAPVFPASATAWSTSISREAGQARVADRDVRPVGRGAKAPDAATQRALDGSMDEARAALRKGRYAEAVRGLKEILRHGENPLSAEAHELLGVAYDKSGQKPSAAAEYEDYLKRYASGEGNDRVRQRLAGVKAALGETIAGPKPGDAASTGEKRWKSSKPRESWIVSGSASQFYIRDDSYRQIRDPSLPPEVNPDKDDHHVHQNQLLSSFDLIAAWNNEAFKSKFRFTGTEEHGFDDAGRDIIGIASLYGETTYLPWGVTGRLGRQTRFTGGVLGRFDGALVSWQTTPWARVNVVAGSPVQRRQDGFFENERYFYGASLDFGPFLGGFEASVFAVEQRDQYLLDRQAIGTELRYLDPIKTALLTVDYDVHFNQLNAAIASGSYRFADKSVFNIGADYRKSPYLSAWTALQSQPFLTLYDMLKLRTKDEIDQLAIDRTPTYRSATAGYTRPLNEHFQLSFDATATNVTGTIASGGIAALPGTGNEFYYSAQLMGTSLLEKGDLYIAGVRIADRADSNLYVLDLTARYPMFDNMLSLSPRLRVGYRVGDEIDLKEYSALPSLQLNYFWTRNLSLELEAGVRWTSKQLGPFNETETELLFTAGVRYDFSIDDQSKCKPIPVNCQ